MEQGTADLELCFPQQRGYNKSQPMYSGIASQRGNTFFSNVQLKCSILSYVMPQKKSTQIPLKSQLQHNTQGAKEGAWIL